MIDFGRQIALVGVVVGCLACSKSGGKADAGAIPGTGGAPVAGAGGEGTGGVAGAGGLATGAGGIAGTTGTGGGAGTGGRPAGTCTFDVQHAQSAAISTVEIVTWTLDVDGLTEAHIDFGPAGAAPTMTAPVDLRDPRHRTVLVGMKAAKPYTFRVVATDGAKTCTSPDVSFTTGALPTGAPKNIRTMSSAGAAKGFLVAAAGIGSQSGQLDAYIFDTDGDLVWWTSSGLASAAEGVSRAHLSWDAKALWVMTSSTSKIISVSMDGMTVTDYSNTVAKAHHDFTVLPEGGIATMVGPPKGGATGESIVEIKADGTVSTVVADLATLYKPGFYPNAIHYYAADDSYTLSDRSTNTNLFVKFKRNGALVWQLGGTNPIGKSFALVGLEQWKINHGHHLTADGHFLFFNNGNTTGMTDMPRAIEVLLDETNNTATKTWEYQMTGTSIALGDVERLPNGHVLVTNSGSSMSYEVDASGNVVQAFNTLFGYVDFRTSLYGPPPR